MRVTTLVRTLKIILLSIGCYAAGTQTLAQSSYSPDVIIKINETRSYTSAPVQGKFKSRDHFVQTMLPHAITAGRTLGVDPKVILAQAALETNWGQHILKNADKRISHNIFAIKYTPKKGGQSLTTRTKEFQNGKALYKKQQFRSYENFREAFEDYTRIIQRAHYRKHMKDVRTPLDYAQGLQKAGYATDPKYAKKIMLKYQDPSLKNIKI